MAFCETSLRGGQRPVAVVEHDVLIRHATALGEMRENAVEIERRCGCGRRGRKRAVAVLVVVVDQQRQLLRWRFRECCGR
jgi:hypothetical protein